MEQIYHTSFCDKSNTYEVRGLCMLLILFHHIYVQLLGMDVNVPYVGMFLAPGGYLGTGLFFFMSGYGLYYSMSSRKELPYSYLWKRLYKMYSVYVIAFVLAVFPLVLRNECGGADLLNFITLTIPNTTSWFFKVIVVTYIVTFLVFRSHMKELFKVGLIVGICILYYIISCNFLPDFWFTSVLCFPIGMIVAYRKNIFSDKLQLFLAIAFIPLFLKMQGVQVRFITSIMFCFFVLYLIRIIKYKSFVLNYIGVNSLCFYLFQLALLQNLHDVTSSPFLYSLLVILSVILMSVLYVKVIQPYSNKLYDKLCV